MCYQFYPKFSLVGDYVGSRAGLHLVGRNCAGVEFQLSVSKSVSHPAAMAVLAHKQLCMVFHIYICIFVHI